MRFPTATEAGCNHIAVHVPVREGDSCPRRKDSSGHPDRIQGQRRILVEVEKNILLIRAARQ